MNPRFGRLARWSIRDDITLINDRCDRYEKAWNGEVTPRIEDYLDGVEGDVATALWLELVMVDQQLRQKSGEKPTLADYKERCPDAQAFLDVSTDGGVLPLDDLTMAPGASAADPLKTTAGPDNGLTRALKCPAPCRGTQAEVRGHARQPASGKPGGGAG